MSFAVKVVKIRDVIAHDNADRLELAQIDGWQCVIQKGAYKAGDLAVYIPIDSVLPEAIETKLFGPDSKVKLSKGRVRTIKLRGAISQGMLGPCDVLEVPAKEGYDCTEKLGIIKFEPPEAPANMRSGMSVKRRAENPLFHKYGGLDNFKNHNTIFAPGDDCIVTEKIHGSNFRCGWIPTAKDTLWKKVLGFFRLLPEYEFVFGSNNVQLQNKMLLDSFGQKNVYAEAVKKYNLKEQLKDWKGLLLYGEVYGDGIQKNYNYECGPGEQKFIAFDLRYSKNGAFADWATFNLIMTTLPNVPTVPVLYEGPFDEAKIKALTKGNSVLAPTQKVREGVVIKSRAEVKCKIGRKCLKLISDEYLLKEDNTDFH